MLPHFLIIGAMKSGTTSLYFDLMTQGGIHFPEEDKEPGCLASDRVLTAEGRSAYERYYRHAPEGAIAGDASTVYAKLPDVPGVPARAREVLGAQAKVIYLVREPLSRTISQHYHEYTSGGMGPNIDEEVHRHARLIDYSRYAMQIEPWLEEFGDAQVRVVRFESYIGDRVGVASEIAGWLGGQADPGRVEAGKVFNQGEGKGVLKGPWKRVAENPLYRHGLRKLIGPGAREKLRGLLLPKAPPKPAGPNRETVEFVLDAVEPEADRLRGMLGWEEPIWDFGAVRERYLGPAHAEGT
jgi:hypothetical protein